MKRRKRYAAAFFALSLVIGALPFTGSTAEAEEGDPEIQNVARLQDPSIQSSRDNRIGEEQINADYDWLTFDVIRRNNTDPGNIVEYLSLPVEGPNGSEIFWSTSDSSAMLNSGVPLPDSTAEKTAVLTVRIVSGSAEREKQFELTVAPGTPDSRPLHILQIGDSNTEGARITQGMNEVLDEKYGDYGDGYITLARDYYGWGDRTPEDYSISYEGNWTQYDLGLEGANAYNAPFGIFVETWQQGAAITVEFVGSAVDIHYLSMSFSGTFGVTIDGVKETVRQANDDNLMVPKKAVFDDLEYGKHTMVLTNEDGGHINFYGADYRVDDAKIRKNISTWGNSGIRAYDFAEWLNPDLFKESLVELNPDVVAILLGTNDNGGGITADEVSGYLSTVVGNVQKALPDAEIWILSTFETVNPSDGLQTYWDTAFPETAKKMGVHYWDMGEWFGPYSTDLMQDSHHCNISYGYQLAQKMHEVITAGEDVIGRNIISAEENAAVQVKTGTAFEDLDLPRRVQVKLDDLQNTLTTADVEWSAEGYDKDSEGVYTLTGTLTDDNETRIYNPDNVTAQITVDVKDSYENEEDYGLELYYDFENIEGSTVHDKTGNYDGTIAGNVTAAEGINGGKALHFPNDRNTYVDIPVEVFENLRDVTVSAWVNMEEVSTWTTLLGVGSDIQNYFQLVASGIPSTGACGISAAIKDTKGKEYRTNSAAQDTPPIGQWCMVTYTQEGSEGRLYLNGELVAVSDTMRKTFADIAGAENATAHLGAPQVWPDPAVLGAVDEFMIYNYAFTEEEVKDAMDRQLNGEKHTPVFVEEKAATCTEEGNIAYWKCTDCGKYFSDEACTEELLPEDVVIEMTEHNYNDGICIVCGAEDPEYDPGEDPEDPVLDRIEVTSLPDKTEYKIGDTLDLAGMVVTAYYSNNESEEITGYTVEEFDSSAAGEVELTVRYEDKTAVFTVTVTEDTTEPGGEDPDQPGGEDPSQPGGEDPDQPGGEDPDQPGGEDPDQPGGEDPDQPGGEDPDQPGGEDPDQPGGEDPSQPGGEDPDQTDGDVQEPDTGSQGGQDTDNSGNDKTDNSNSGQTVSSPKTGDTAQPGIYMAIILACAGTVVFVLNRSKRSNGR